VTAFEQYVENIPTDSDDKFAYHKNYVEEIVKNNFMSRQKGQDVRKSFDGGRSYSVPPFDPLVAKSNRPKTIRSLLLLLVCRVECLVRVDELMWLSAVESLRSSRREF